MKEDTYRVDACTLRGDWPVLTALVLDLAFGLWVWPRLPAQVPMHWGLNGQPDRLGPAWEGAIVFPLLASGLYLAMLFTPLLDPRRANYVRFAGFYRLLRQAIPLLLVLLHLAVTLGALGYPVDPVLAVRVALPLLFILIGNYLGQVRPNYFVGLRTPWTLASETIWTRTHRLAGRLWVAGGILQMAAALLSPAWGMGVFVGLLVLMVVVPLVYSYRLYQQHQG